MERLPFVYGGYRLTAGLRPLMRGLPMTAGESRDWHGRTTAVVSRWRITEQTICVAGSRPRTTRQADVGTSQTALRGTASHVSMRDAERRLIHQKLLSTNR